MSRIAILLSLVLSVVFLRTASSFTLLQDEICDSNTVDMDLCYKILQGDPRTRRDVLFGLPFWYASAVTDLAVRNVTDIQTYIKSLLSNASGDSKEKLSKCFSSYSTIILHLNQVTDYWKLKHFGTALKVARNMDVDLLSCEGDFNGIKSPLSQKNHNALVFVAMVLKVAKILWPIQ